MVHTPAELARARERLAGVVGLVPTMGALHDGHAALIRAARARCDTVVVSIFVNPMQFNQAADLARYPRPLEADLARCRELGVDLVFNPSVDTMYPGGPVQVWVTAGELADQLEGPNRPGHFDGVLTVVTKLFTAVRPQRAFFGEKDYQQLVLVRQLSHDLGLDVEVVGVGIVRDPDGLALSSRNVFLSEDERRRALALPRALQAGRDSGRSASAIVAAARAVLDATDGIEVEYLELRTPDLRLPEAGAARLLVAARVGQTRLIDNIAVEIGGGV
ncbi:pantoate--beta-alanine ligase [Jatrophihabitans telluris]|uniref:Pantothenate synthetase n=1 Tax=Jatrophihabitans telluris TaxID=2038343 RepID=A0ABY4R092_9ACTN|nr:pantoate--beta-alanine ligase [Jatrophihabitans telluris]UQX88922.1 pantoate--beta-alanine ligase [Jatrophihabitans telluris]